MLFAMLFLKTQHDFFLFLPPAVAIRYHLLRVVLMSIRWVLIPSFPVLVLALQLLRWDPCSSRRSGVSASGTTVAEGLLEDMTWFAATWKYCSVIGDSASEVIPRVVSTAVVPRLVAVIQSSWDVYSSRGTQRLAAAVQDVCQYEVTDDAKKVQLSAIV